MADKAPSLIGALLEQRYRVDALLARGGMSAVYRGLDTRLDRPVAIKVMDPRFADDRSFVDRFEREARSAAKIRHPNVVAVHDQGVDRTPAGNLVFLVMELVEGGTLRDLLSQRGALPVPLALSVLEPVLSALAAAHRAGLIHRDVKPENVLIGRDGDSPKGIIKVADFGLVRAIASAGTTSSKIILGTVAYLSPEQVTTGAATARGDVYSAGVLLYETLTGHPPYSGDTPLSIAYRHVNDDVPPPSAAVAGIPPALDDLVVRVTRRDPSSRPVDGAAFLHELQEVAATLALPRIAVPVPGPAPTDRTVPVPDELRAKVREHASAEESSVPAAQPEAAETGSDQTVRTAGVPPETDAEKTVSTLTPIDQSTALAGVGAATTVRQRPAGFQAAGPQGTKAMLRADLERAAMGAAPPQLGPPMGPPTGPQLGPPSGPHPMPYPMVGPPTGPQPSQPPPADPRRRDGRGRQIALLTLIGVLVLALIGTATWWFAAGRWTSVPSVAGQDLGTAERTLTDADLNPQVTHARDDEVPAGTVIRTDPAGGAKALRGDQVTLVVSMGKPKVPDVQPGTSVEEASSAIEAVELQPQRDDGQNEFHDQVPEGAVVRLNPPAGTVLNIGAPVVVVVSKGPAPKPVPDVRNKTRDEAFQALRDAGFDPFEAQAEFAPDIDGGRVVRTDPPANTTIQSGQSNRIGVILSTAVTVPNVGQQTVADAQRILTELGLQVEVQFGQNPASRVFGQNPAPGTRVERNTKVIIYGFP